MAGGKATKGQPGRAGQSVKRIPASAYEWVLKHEVAARAACNLRIKGLSEKAILANMKEAYPDGGGPSINRLRAAFVSHGLETRHQATIQRRNSQMIAADGQVRQTRNATSYIERRRAQFTEPAKVRLERNFTLAYLANEGIRVHPDADIDIDYVFDTIEGS